MWLNLAFASALLLGCYDVAKKQSLKKNSVMWVLFAVSAISTIVLIPWFKSGSQNDFLILIPKAFFVATCWITGLKGMKLLPLTTASVIKASRPVFVILLSIILFGERLSSLQWCAVALALTALFLLSRTSREDDTAPSARKDGWMWMFLSVVSGVASALYDKYVVQHMDPIFVLCWSNAFVTVLMGLVLGYLAIRDGEKRARFRFDPLLILTAVLIVGADALYFVALSREGAMLSIISLVRRASVVVTFALSALIFKEKNIRFKAFALSIMILAMVCLFAATIIN